MEVIELRIGNLVIPDNPNVKAIHLDKKENTKLLSDFEAVCEFITWHNKTT